LNELDVPEGNAKNFAKGISWPFHLISFFHAFLCFIKLLF
jgi:hypothetical protein